MGERAHEPPEDITMGTHIDDLVRLLDDHDLRDAVLLGHSYGGLPITGAANRRPERVGDLVYLDALVPEHGQSCADVLGPGFVAAAAAAMTRANTPHSIPWLFTPDDLLGPGSPLAGEVAERMTAHPAGTLHDPVDADRIRARRHYVYCTGSASLGLTGGFAAAARDSAAWRYSELDAPHDAPHACPDQVAQVVARISSR
ncbi:pimeloyl-ACP methyl ester carboxylesterase [Actinokineospora baliensis]|nr:pimeloyl-ACP methyl ester carboxylesterase [Actinokineospora baliensis]